MIAPNVVSFTCMLRLAFSRLTGDAFVGIGLKITFMNSSRHFKKNPMKRLKGLMKSKPWTKRVKLCIGKAMGRAPEESSTFCSYMK